MALRPTISLTVLLAGLLLMAGAASAGGKKWQITPGKIEVSGNVSVEGFFVPEAGMQSGQTRTDLSVAAEPEFYMQWQGGRKRFLISPYLRLDQRDDERTAFDLREAYIQLVENAWDVKVGVGKVFWGVTEARHLVDIVNQTDLAAEWDGDAKLGQPMVNLNFHNGWGSLGLFVLPGFRERTFPGRDGRQRTTPRPDTDVDATYESGAKRRHVDVAARWAHTFGDLDLALSQFYGTSRDPLFTSGTNAGGESVLIPHYEIIGQTGLELLYARGNTLWKGEAFYRTGQLENFVALDAGLEHTLTGAFGSTADVGLLAEYLYESRPLGASEGKTYLNSLSNDVMIGMRLTLNDADSTEGLVTATFDLQTSAKFFTAEFSRRIGQSFKARLEGRILSGLAADAPLYSMREDDFVRLALEYHF